MEKAIFKFNSGDLALLCTICRTILKTGKDFTPEEHDAYNGLTELPSQFCTKCQPK